MISFLVYTLSLSVYILPVLSSGQTCGQSSDCPVLPVALIRGGQHSCIESHPWSAFLVRADSLLFQSDLDIFCGASIITKHFLISAAHCLLYAPAGHSLTKEEIYIYVGLDNRVFSTSDKDYYEIEHFDIHPDWDNTGDVDDGNDIVIIKVIQPIIFSPTVAKICLPNENQSYLVEVGREVRFAGFGKTSPSAREPPQTLQESDFNIVQCDANAPNNICAAKVIGGTVTSSICAGDSGGGLIARENGSNFLVGVVSWNLGQLCNMATQYVNVFKHLSWIRSIVEVCYSQRGTKCILPFTFQRKTHYECISPSSTDQTLATVCPTKLNTRGKIAPSSFTHCSSSCPGFKHQAQPEGTTQAIFIVGGLPSSSVGKTTEVLDMDTSSSCTRSTPDIPRKRYGHTVNYVDGVVIVCGGYTSSTEQKCISSRSPSGPWLPHSNTKAKRAGHSSVVAAGRLHLIGGDFRWSAVTMETLEGDTWTLHDLPYTVSGGSCSVQTAHNQFVLTGGVGSRTKMSKWSEGNVWEFLPDLTFGRWEHGCTSVTLSGVVHVVVAGGKDFSGTKLSSSSIYNMDTGRWTDMGNMEEARYWGVMINIRYGAIHRVLIMGGRDGDNNDLSSMEELDIDQDNVDRSTWKLLSSSMIEAKSSFGAVAVPKSIFC